MRHDTALQPDGRLDDDIYARVGPLTDFLQQEPRDGEPATEKTDAWSLFDDPGQSARRAARRDGHRRPAELGLERHLDVRTGRFAQGWTGSELFVVYSDGRDTRARGVPALVNRTLAVKATRLFRF